MGSEQKEKEEMRAGFRTSNKDANQTESDPMQDARKKRQKE